MSAFPNVNGIAEDNLCSIFYEGMLVDWDSSVAPIRGFKTEEHKFLSNFYPCKIGYWDHRFNCVEQLYVYHKTHNQECKDAVMAMGAERAGAMKRKGSKFPPRPDWNTYKLKIMREAVFCKFFQNPELQDKLLATGNAYIEETNWWGDTFYGVCDGVGQNQLGILLMAVRQRLREVREEEKCLIGH